MITDSKILEIFCLLDDFSKEYNNFHIFNSNKSACIRFRILKFKLNYL